MRTPDYLPLCSIAGWDPTCGAGAGADLRVFSAHGGHGAAVLACLTVQDASGLSRLEASEPGALRGQLAAVLASRPPRAVKVGLLPNPVTIETVAAALRDLDVPVVWDPVLSVSAGGWEADPATVTALREHLLPVAGLVTPNADEVRRLAGLPADADPRDAARALLARGSGAVLATGGDDEATARDWLIRPDSDDRAFELSHVDGGPFHGTGCALSSAIAVRLAQGRSLEDAIGQAKQYVHALLALAAQTDAWLLPHLAVRPS